MSRYNLRIKVGTYTGTGVTQDVAGVGFRPKFVIAKGGANVACVRSAEMGAGLSVSMSSALALAVNQLQGFLNDGFQVGTSALVNANSTTYYYIAMSWTDAQTYIRSINYKGSGANDRNLTRTEIGFTPDLGFIFGDTTQTKVWRSSSMTGDLSQYFGGVAGATDRIQNFQSNGMQLGTSSEVNGSNLNYYALLAKVFPGSLAIGTYAGDGADNRSITGVGFDPNAVIVKRDGASHGRLLTSDMTADNSTFLGAAGGAVNGIQSLIADGFTIGTDNSVNNASSTYYWIAFKDGDFITPIIRTAV